MADRWEDYFEPGEKLLWEGHPKPNSSIGLLNILLALFGLPFLIAGLAVLGAGLGEIFSFKGGIGNVLMGFFMLFFSLPFIAVGFAMIFGPWYMQSTAHRKMRYALSDRCAYIATQYWSRKMAVFPISPDGAIELESGDSVYFHTETGRDSDGDKTTERKGFANIADAQKVYHLIRDVQTKLARESTCD